MYISPIDSNRREEVRILSFPLSISVHARTKSGSSSSSFLFPFPSFSSSFSLNVFPTRESRRTGLPSQRVCSLFLPSFTLYPSSNLLPLGLTRESSRATVFTYAFPQKENPNPIHALPHVHSSPIFQTPHYAFITPSPVRRRSNGITAHT